MPKLPDGTTLKTPDTDLPAKVTSSLEKGITPKTILGDNKGTFYVAKQPDTLTVEDVFTGYVSNTDELHPASAAKHIFSLQVERAFLEILLPRMIGKLFHNVIKTPETFLHVDGQSIWIISKFMDGFSEFLANKPIVKENSPLFDLVSLPQRKDLHLTTEEAKIIGQLYAAALTFNIWDLFNSKLLNSGYCDSNDSKTAAIVDFGCSAHISYKGRHTDTLALDDPNFIKGKPIKYSFFGQNYRDHYRHDHVLPFDTKVAPLLTHSSIVADLFDMSSGDEISNSMLEGFRQALIEAEKNLAQNPHLLETALNDAYEGICLDSTIKATGLKAYLNQEFYSSSGERKHTLIGIIRQRLASALELIPKFEKRISAVTIQEEVRDFYYSANMTGGH